MQSFVVLHIKPFCSQQHRIQTLQQPHTTLRAKKAKKSFNNFSIYNIFTLNGVNNLYRIILDAEAIWENLLYTYIKLCGKIPFQNSRHYYLTLVYPFSNSNHSPIHEHLISLPFIFLCIEIWLISSWGY